MELFKQEQPESFCPHEHELLLHLRIIFHICFLLLIQ